MIIGQDGIKRKLASDRPFLLILSKEEAEALRDQLQVFLSQDNVSYGAMTVYPGINWCGTTGGEPLPWRA